MEPTCTGRERSSNAIVAAMKDRGLRFRSEIVSGPGGRQIQLLDPDENHIELFEPASRS